jgi:branched-chain amino acid transport system ATP-binding protein
LLEVADLEAGYGGAPAIKGVSLVVGDCEIVTLIGSNGAGKSTTLRTLSGLLPVKRGRMTFRGEAVAGRKPHEIVRRGLIHVPEGRRVFADMTVRENLTIGGYTAPREALAQRLDRVFAAFPRLTERRDQLAGRMSGGEQQMLAIGRGLMADPKLLMLDEPSLGLAPKLVTQIAELIVAIRGMGIAVLLVEQNARLALEISDRAYVLQTGTVALSGKSVVLKHDPQVRKAYLGLD